MFYMSANFFTKTITRCLVTLRVLTVGIPLIGWALPSHAGKANADFNVTVTLEKSALANMGLCSSHTGVGAFSATVTVVCTTGIAVGLEAIGKGMPWLPVHGGAYRFVTNAYNANQSARVDSYTGTDTSTAFNTMNSAGQDYIEMTIGW